MSRVDVVVDLQFGSTGKGALAGLLATYLEPDVVATSWGPNAGHTFIDSAGNKYVHTMLANAMCLPSVFTQLIGPGSVINMDALVREVKFAGPRVEGKEIVIHPNACFLLPRHPVDEAVLIRVGSTMKGTGAANAEKIWRDPMKSPLIRDIPSRIMQDTKLQLATLGIHLIVDEATYMSRIARARHILIEGAQGFSLGSHTEFWPHCTSRDISVAQLFADCRIPFELSAATQVWGTARTFPIRVANRFNAGGDMVGTSGPGYPDQVELDWKTDLNREPELTTVTKLPRRIFSFSNEQIRAACEVCSPDVIALTFADYIEERPAINCPIGPKLTSIVEQIWSASGAKTYTRILTYGPSIDDAVLLDNDGLVRWLNDANFAQYVMDAA